MLLIYYVAYGQHFEMQNKGEKFFTIQITVLLFQVQAKTTLDCENVAIAVDFYIIRIFSGKWSMNFLHLKIFNTTFFVTRLAKAGYERGKFYVHRVT